METLIVLTSVEVLLMIVKNGGRKYGSACVAVYLLIE